MTDVKMGSLAAAELAKSYEPASVEAHWSRIWEERGCFTANPNSAREPYCLVLPPPNVTGSLHLGHALTATIQDVLIRWKRMLGFEALWVPGMDHAGIATQMVVERELLATDGKSRQDLGREAFTERVWKWKANYGAKIGEQHRRLGASLDWSRERFTLDSGLSLAVREVFVRLYEEGLIYRAQRLIHWDPELLTALSDLEVENEERDGTLWSIAYPVVGSAERLTVATTRPETMLGDSAIAVHPEDSRYRHLIGKTALLPLLEREIPIIGDAELVDPTFGTGVVKVTPAHDHRDYATGQRHGLPMINIFTERAVVNENGGPYAGLDRFEAREKVLSDLEAQGFLVEAKPYRIPLAVSQRSKSPVEPRLSWQWYVRVAPLAEAALAAVHRGDIRFVPEGWTNTFYAWMNNIHDWCISRQLWWGHQIPAWYPVDSQGQVDWTASTFVVAREAPSQGKWIQDTDVLDTWFSSALWPFSALGWPSETEDLKRFYPNALLETGHDIIFYWVARMVMMGIHFMGKPPFPIVYLHAMVRDEKGEKMSKTKGNVIDPLDIIGGAPAKALPPAIRNRYPEGLPPMGADALRLTLAQSTQQGREIRLSIDRVAGSRAFCNKLWNAARFAMMNLHDWKPTGEPVRGGIFDAWITSRLERTVEAVNQSLEGFDFSAATSAAYQFTWGDFCDWYIEVAKSALQGEDADARRAAQSTLVQCLDRTLRLLHPFIPFITEEIWQRLPISKAEETLATSAYPIFLAMNVDAASEAQVAPVLEVVSAIRVIRSESGIHPAERIFAVVHAEDPAMRSALTQQTAVITRLAGLGEFRAIAPESKPRLAASQVLRGAELFVPLSGIVDLSEERNRLQRELDRSRAEWGSLDRKLSNASFVARAPSEIVDRDRERVAELAGRMKKISANLQNISEVPE